MTPLDPQRQRLFEECVERCADSMYRVAFRLTSNQTLARELVQETFLNAWKGIGSLGDDDKMRSWMFAILRNQYSKLIRKESKSIGTREDLDHVLTVSNAAQTCYSEGPEQSNEMVDTVQAAIGELDEKHKLPVLLVSMEELSVEEAANILDLPKGTVLSRLHRARQKLKEILIRKGVEPMNHSQIQNQGSTTS